MQPGPGNGGNDLQKQLSSHARERTVPLSKLIHDLVGESYDGLLKVAESTPNLPDAERKRVLVDFLQQTRNRFIKLLVVVRWSSNVPFVKKCWEILQYLDKQDTQFTSAADTLFITHANLQLARAPIYDIPTAIDVLTTGSYQRLPTKIEEPIPRPPLSSSEVQRALQRLNRLLHLRMFLSHVPAHFSSIRVDEDRVHCLVEDEFEATLTVDGEELNDPWRLVSFRILVAPEPGVGEAIAMASVQQQFLHDLLQNRLRAAAADPFLELYRILHTTCVLLVMQLLDTQAERLARSASLGRLSLQHAQRSSLRISYWLPDEPTGREARVDEARAAPYLEVYLEGETDEQRLRVRHSPPINAAVQAQLPPMNIVGTAVNAARLVSWAVSARVASRLHQLHSDLLTSFSPADLQLAPLFQDNDKFLRVRLDEEFWLYLRIHRPTGRYSLRLDGGSKADWVAEFEEELNRDETQIVELITKMRAQIILESYNPMAAALHFEFFSSLPMSKQALSLAGLEGGAPRAFLRFPPPDHDVYLSITLEPDARAKFHVLVAKRRETQPLLLDVESVTPVTDVAGDALPQHHHIGVPDGTPGEDAAVSERPAAKRRRLDGATAVSVGATVAEREAVLRSLFVSCRCKHRLRPFVSELDAKGIEHKQVTTATGEAGVVFKLPSSAFPLAVASLCAVVRDDCWAVTVEETPRLVSIPGLPVGESLPSGGNQWTLVYPAPPDGTWLQLLRRDLAGIAALLSVRLRLEAFLRTELAKGFSVEACSFTHVGVAYNHNPQLPQQKLDFRWQLSKGASLHLAADPPPRAPTTVPANYIAHRLTLSTEPQHPCQHLYQSMLVEAGRVREICEAVVRTTPLVQTIGGYLGIVPYRSKDVERATVLTNPGEYVLTTLSPYEFRLVFRNAFGFDITINEKQATFQDAALSQFSERVRSPVFNVCPTPKLDVLLKRLHQSFNSAANGEELPCVSATNPREFVFPKDQVMKVIHFLSRYLRALTTVNRLYHSVSQEKMQPAFDGWACRFVNPTGVTYMATVENWAQVAVVPVPPFPEELKEEVDLVCTFFRNKVNTSVAVQTLPSAVTLLNLPAHILKQFAPLIRRDAQGPTDAPVSFRLPVSAAVRYAPAENKLSFTIAISIKRGPEPREIKVPLCYFHGQNGQPSVLQLDQTAAREMKPKDLERMKSILVQTQLGPSDLASKVFSFADPKHYEL